MNLEFKTLLNTPRYLFLYFHISSKKKMSLEYNFIYDIVLIAQITHFYNIKIM